jgi:hypothetical protein
VKKATAILMLCVYALLSLGIQLHLHYCCGHLSDFHFLPVEHCSHGTESEDDHCCKKGNCCSFIHIDLKVDDSHQPSETARFIPIETAPSIHFALQEQTKHSGFPDFESESHSPPPICRRYVLYRSLVLYA